MMRINQVMAIPLVGLIWLYQKTVSPDHGLLRFLFPYGYCKYHPSCSMYARITLHKQGLLGLPKVIRRLLACTPGSLGGVDLP